MACEVSSSDGERCKRIKLSSDSEDACDSSAEDLSSYSRINSLEGFKLNQILSDNGKSKSVFFAGTMGETDEKAVVLLEKQPIVKESISRSLNNADLALNLVPSAKPKSNAMYYAFYPNVERGDVKATVICPATPKHIEKYLCQPMHVVHETPELYENIVQPHLLSQKFSIQWVYNILEHKSESERILYEDSDPEIGFILLPDLKWDDSQRGCIYLIAICHKKSIKSLRELNGSHLPLLKNIRSKSLDAIWKKYNIPLERLRIYVHYQPSYYHFHVHFNSVEKLMPGSQYEKAHLLDTIIENIELCSSYYQKAVLTYTIKENDPLYKKLKEASVIKV